MKFESLNLLAALPEIALLLGVCVVLLVDALVPAHRRIPSSVLALLAIVAFTAWFLWGALVRVHARMQAALRDLIEHEPLPPP